MTRIITLMAAWAVAISAWAGCPDTHFNFAVETARAALEIPTSPRFTYLPEDTPRASDRHLCRMVADTLLKQRDESDHMGFATQTRDRALPLLACIDDAVGDATLPNLEFVYVGHPDDAEAARQTVEGWGAKFLFRSDQDYLSPSQSDGDALVAANRCDR